MSSTSRLSSVAVFVLAFAALHPTTADAASLTVGPLQSLNAAASELTSDSAYGLAVAANDDWAFVGAPGNNKVYVFRHVGTAWQLQSLALVGTSGDDFGFSLALSGDRLLVGAPGNAVDKGVVYAYQRNASNVWAADGVIAASDRASNEKARFGTAVAISGTKALIGAPNDDHSQVGTDNDFGAAYGYTRGTSWGSEQKFLGLLPAGDSYAANANYGNTVALDGDKAMVGTKAQATTNSSWGGAAVHAFAPSGAGGAGVLLTPGSPALPGDDFGTAIAMDGNWALIGSPASDSSQGAVYAYEFVSTQWTFRQRFQSDASTETGWFGAGVALSGTRAVVAARFGGADEAGRAHVYSRTGSSWQKQLPTLASSVPGSSNFASGSLAISGSALVIGQDNVPAAFVATVAAAPDAKGLPVLGARGPALLTALLGLCGVLSLRRRRAASALR